jgi:hypothetical protein
MVVYSLFHDPGGFKIKSILIINRCHVRFDSVGSAREAVLDHDGVQGGVASHDIVRNECFQSRQLYNTSFRLLNHIELSYTTASHSNCSHESSGSDKNVKV